LTSESIEQQQTQHKCFAPIRDRNDIQAVPASQLTYRRIKFAQAEDLIQHTQLFPNLEYQVRSAVIKISGCTASRNSILSRIYRVNFAIRKRD